MRWFSPKRKKIATVAVAAAPKAAPFVPPQTISEAELIMYDKLLSDDDDAENGVFWSQTPDRAY